MHLTAAALCQQGKHRADSMSVQRGSDTAGGDKTGTACHSGQSATGKPTAIKKVGQQIRNVQADNTQREQQLEGDRADEIS